MFRLLTQAIQSSLMFSGRGANWMHLEDVWRARIRHQNWLQSSFRHTIAWSVSRGWRVGWLCASFRAQPHFSTLWSYVWAQCDCEIEESTNPMFRFAGALESSCFGSSCHTPAYSSSDAHRVRYWLVAAQHICVDYLRISTLSDCRVQYDISHWMWRFIKFAVAPGVTAGRRIFCVGCLGQCGKKITLCRLSGPMLGSSFLLLSRFFLLTSSFHFFDFGFRVFPGAVHHSDFLRFFIPIFGSPSFLVFSFRQTSFRSHFRGCGCCSFVCQFSFLFRSFLHVSVFFPVFSQFFVLRFSRRCSSPVFMFSTFFFLTAGFRFDACRYYNL